MMSSAFQGSILAGVFALSARVAQGNDPAKKMERVTSRVRLRELRLIGGPWIADELTNRKHSRIDANRECGTLSYSDRAEREEQMAAAKPIFSKEIFQFFRELSKHNQKTWMDANRERYQAVVVKPFRALL